MQLLRSFLDEGHAQIKGPATRPFVAELVIAGQSHKPFISPLWDTVTPLVFLESRSAFEGQDLKEGKLESLEIEQLLGGRRRDRCVVFPALTAQWQHAHSMLKLSGAAAAALVSSKAIRWTELDLLTYKESQGLPAAGSRFLGPIYAVLLLVSRVLYSNLPGIGREHFAEDNCRCFVMRDPLRRARMTQAWFDLGMARGDVHWDAEGYVFEKWEEMMQRGWERKSCLRTRD